MSKQKTKKSDGKRAVTGFLIGALLGFLFPVVYSFFSCSTEGCGPEGMSALFVLTIYFIPFTTPIGAIIGVFISLL